MCARTLPTPLRYNAEPLINVIAFQVERFVDKKVDKTERLLKQGQARTRRWYHMLTGSDDSFQPTEFHFFLISYVAGLALGIATANKVISCCTLNATKRRIDIHVATRESCSTVIDAHDNIVDEYNNTIMDEVRNKINALKNWVARTTLNNPR